MKQFLKLVTTIVLNLASANAETPSDKKTDGFICYGPGFAYTTQAPKGWKLDSQSGKANNLCLVGYPKDSSWETGDTVIYINPSVKGKTPGSRDLADMIAYDVTQHKKNSPELTIKDGEVVLNKGKKITTKYFFNDMNNFEAVGYIDETNAVVFVVMSARNKIAFDKALPAFKEFIQSYRLVSNNVKIKK